MRTPTLQYLYLQKPITMIIFICIVSVLPWLGLSDLYTPIQTADTVTAEAMLKSGNWVLPTLPSGEICYDHPILPWLITIFSSFQGYISKLTLQLPGALAFIVMMACSLIFFGRRIKFHEAFISTLFLITCAGMQNLSAASSGDLLFAAFVFVALTQLYRWEEDYELKGIPVEISIILSLAILTKGLMGVIMPIVTFTVYLLIHKKQSYRVIFKSMIYMAVSSLFLPALWYVSIWKEGGSDVLLDIMRADFSDFFGLEAYTHSFFYIFPILAIGFFPWIVFFFFSLFGVKMEKKKIACSGVKLFSLVAMIVLLLFYALMPVKKASYLLPVYPFITIFLAQYAIHITEYRTWCTRVFAVFSLAFVLFAVGLIYFPVDWIPIHFGVITWQIRLLLALTGIVWLITAYQLSKKNNIKILYATIALTYTVNMLINASGLSGV